MRRLLALLLLLLAAPLAAQEFPALSGRVVDAANILPPDVEAKISARSEAIEKQTGAQLVHGGADRRAGVRIEARQDMRRAGDDAHAASDLTARHVERHGEVRRAVVDRRQQMTMKVDHLAFKPRRHPPANLLKVMSGSILRSVKPYRPQLSTVAEAGDQATLARNHA